MKYLIILLLCVPLCGFGAETAEWPDLAEVPSVSGRAATLQDLKQGAAAFVLQEEGGTIGKPIDIAIPQYALYKDAETGETIKVVIIQAEHAHGMDIYGAMDIKTGQLIASAAPDFTLLGRDIE